MEERNIQDLMVNAAIALFSGAVGCLLTLFVTGNLTWPNMANSDVTAIQSAEESQTLMSASALEERVDLTASDELANAGLYGELSDALAEASAERAQLADSVLQLTRQIEILESDAINRQAREALSATDTTDAIQGGDLAGAGIEGSNGRSDGQQRIDSLIAAGVDPEQAQAIQARQDQYQLARLDLIDQAERENWRDTDQFSERMSQLDEQRPDLRDELGDENYDRYLFESGRNNRVMVTAIIPGSVAEIAGLEAGDMVLSYANERIFSTRELQRATREGLRGESVALTVQRQGQTLFFDLPRGPLGVSLSAEQQSPS